MTTGSPLVISGVITHRPLHPEVQTTAGTLLQLPLFVSVLLVLILLIRGCGVLAGSYLYHILRFSHPVPVSVK
jgi:hypothetical protein